MGIASMYWSNQFPIRFSFAKALIGAGVWLCLSLGPGRAGAAAPERIVVAGTPVYTQMLVDLGALPSLVGVTDSQDNPREVKGLPQVGVSMNPNLEQILSLRPDAVLGAYDPLREQLRRLGVRVVTIGNHDATIQSIGEVLQMLRALGVLCERREAAEALVGRIEADIAEVEGRVRGRRRPLVAVVYPQLGGPASGAPYIAGRGTPEDEVVRLAGGENLFAGLHRNPQVSYEELIRGDPEYILTEPAQVSRLQQHPLLRGVRAVRSGHVLGVRAAALASSRLTEPLRLLARALHPDAFPR